jgi:hypothetical protein
MSSLYRTVPGLAGTGARSANGPPLDRKVGQETLT